MRVLIIRTSALGDVVHCLPVLTALRRHFPAARIGWVVEGAMAPVLEGHPDLDELLVVRLRPWRKRPFARATRAELGGFLRALHGFAPDVVLDLMGNHKGGVLAALTLADRRIGAARRSRREPSSAVWINEPAEPRGTHAVDRALSLLAPLGILRELREPEAEPADFGGEKLFREPPIGAAALLATLPEAFALVHPGAGWPNKRYPPARWGEVARRLLAAEGLPTLVGSGLGEEALAREVEAASGGAARAVPAADLPTLAALTRAARLFLGGDSGPTHLAHALGTPTLMVMGPTDPARHGPYGAAENAVWRLLPCSFCYRRFDGPKACLLEIPAERVAARAGEILKAHRNSPVSIR